MALLLVFSGALAAKDKARIQWPLPTFVTALIAVALLSFALGDVKYVYALQCLFVAALAVLSAYCVGRWLREHVGLEITLTYIAWALVMGGVASVAIQFAQIRGIEGLPLWLVVPPDPGLTSQPFANVGQPNQLAIYLCLGVVAALFLHTRALPSWSVAVILATLSVGIAWSGSRMGLLALILVSATVLIWTRCPLFDGRAKRFVMVGAILLGFVAGTAVQDALAASVVGGTSTVERIADAAYGDRLTMWLDAVRITVGAPVIGVGPGEYARAQYWVAQAGEQTIGTPYAHNAVLQFAAEFGVPIAIAFSLLVAWWFLADWQGRRASPELITVWALLAVLGLHAMLEWSLWILFVMIPAALLFAFAEPPVRRGLARISPRPVFVAIGLVGLVWAPLMHLDYSRLANAHDKFDVEAGLGYGLLPEMAEGLRQDSQSGFFRPQADRLALRAMPPVTRPVDPAELRRVERVLSRLPDERVIAVYIIALVLSDRMQDAMPHVERLQAFAVSAERYAAAEEIIRRALKGENSAEPLIREIERLRPAKVAGVRAQ